MRIVILGAGSAGQHLMERLCQENHNVVMVDLNGDRLTAAESSCDVMTIRGQAANPRVLHEAGVDKSDMLVAVTSSDEVNLLACLYGKQIGVKYAVARISEQDYADPEYGVDLKKVGVDLVVIKSETIAEEVFQILRLPGAMEVIDLLGGQAMVAGVRLETDSPLIRAPLQDLAGQEAMANVRFIAAMRGDDLIFPKGDTRFLIGDEIYLVTLPEQIDDVLGWVSPSRPQFNKMIIAGGGDLGLRLAQRLEKTSTNVVLMESNEERAQFCSMELEKALVIHGDALDEVMLREIGVSEKTAFVACKGSDENNMISCMLAEKLGVSYTLARINKLEYVPIINSQSLLDRAVSPQLAITNAILHFIRGQNIQSATLMHRLPGELLEIEIEPDSKQIGVPLQDIHLPSRSLIAAVSRGGKTIIPTGDFTPYSKDRMVVFAHPSAIKKLSKLFLG